MALHANPGGYVPPDQLIGRDRLIQRLWRILGRQSVVLTAERRMGKTSIINKMVAQPPIDGLYFYQDLEEVGSELEFAEKVLDSIHSELSKRHRLAIRARQLLERVGGAEIGGVVKLPEGAAEDGMKLLQCMIEDLLEHHSGPVVFFWDEIPLMLHNLRARSSDAAAMHVLDHLRALRQTQPRLRMVFTGSIGLHNVVVALRRAGHANAATNDMHVQDVPPLGSKDAAELAYQLLLGEEIASSDPSRLAGVIASAVDGVPYFIHHVVEQLAQLGEPCDDNTVRGIVDRHLTDAQDDWNLQYYRDRIDTYYPAEESPIALAVLDALAVAKRAIPLAKLLQLVGAHVPSGNEELIRGVLVRLQRDHYVEQDLSGTLRFRFPLIRRFWQAHRGLGA